MVVNTKNIARKLTENATSMMKSLKDSPQDQPDEQDPATSNLPVLPFSLQTQSSTTSLGALSPSSPPSTMYTEVASWGSSGADRTVKLNTLTLPLTIFSIANKQLLRTKLLSLTLKLSSTIGGESCCLTGEPYFLPSECTRWIKPFTSTTSLSFIIQRLLCSRPESIVIYLPASRENSASKSSILMLSFFFLPYIDMAQVFLYFSSTSSLINTSESVSYFRKFVYCILVRVS